MNIKNFLLACFLILFLNTQLKAQHGVCGTSVETQRELLSHRYAPFTSRSNITYAPLRFTIVRNDDGTGGPTISQILDQFTTINADFKATNLQFYLADGPNFNSINNSVVTNDPPASNAFLIGQKSNSAINVYVTKFGRNSGGSGGTVLGYFTPSGDYIVVLDTEISKNSNTVSHEIGHYFSLSHTFLGWENDPYNEAKHGNPVMQNTAGGVTVETVNRSNCSFSADQICDTPPDYNFGFTASSCSFGRIVRDRNGDTIRTQVNNQMSYFNNCASYVFTQAQSNRMNSSLFSPSRFSLRKNYTPVNQPITDNLVINFPRANTTVPSFNNVAFDWENVPNAQYYLFTYTDGRNPVTLVTTSSGLILRDLKPSATYFYTIRPFSEGFTDTRSVTTLFRTGSMSTSVQDLDQKNKLEIFPNPIANKLQGLTIQLRFEASKDVQLQIVDATGRRISNSSHKVQSGNDTINFSTNSLSKGIYFLRIVGDQIDLHKKFVVLD